MPRDPRPWTTQAKLTGRREVSKRHGPQGERSCGVDQRGCSGAPEGGESGGGSKGNTDQAERQRRKHLGDGRAGLVEGGETVEVVGRKSWVDKNWRRHDGE